VISSVEAVVRPVLRAHQLELFDLSFRLEQGGWVLRVTVDRPYLPKASDVSVASSDTSMEDASMEDASMAASSDGLVQGGLGLGDARAASFGSSEQGVTLRDCECVSRDLSTALDVMDPLPHAYALEVSSPSVERPLRALVDYARFAGRPAKLTLCTSREGMGSVVRGVLAGVDGESVLVDVGQPEHFSVALSSIKRANLIYELPAQKKKGSQKKKRRPTAGRRD